MKHYHYLIHIFYSEADRGYVANVPELRFCSAFGTTPQEALSEVEQAIAAWLEAARLSGREIPKPAPYPIHHG